MQVLKRLAKQLTIIRPDDKKKKKKCLMQGKVFFPVSLLLEEQFIDHKNSILGQKNCYLKKSHINTKYLNRGNGGILLWSEYSS